MAGAMLVQLGQTTVSKQPLDGGVDAPNSPCIAHMGCPSHCKHHSWSDRGYHQSHAIPRAIERERLCVLRRSRGRGEEDRCAKGNTTRERKKRGGSFTLLKVSRLKKRKRGAALGEGCARRAGLGGGPTSAKGQAKRLGSGGRNLQIQRKLH